MESRRVVAALAKLVFRSAFPPKRFARRLTSGPAQDYSFAIMSKRFKGLVCAYCSENPAVTGDHVFARQFFLPAQRGNLPQVPACDLCNGDKAKLEHYLTAILPFGGQHADALSNLRGMVAPRLAENQKLHRIIAQGASKVWTHTTSELHARSMAVPFECEKLIELFRYIVRGLMFYDWGVRLTGEHSLDVMLIASNRPNIFDDLMRMRAKALVSGNLGNGTFLYHGNQGTDSDTISAWRFLVYGGLKVTGDPDAPGEKTAQIGALTGPKRVFDRADLRAKWTKALAVGLLRPPMNFRADAW